MVSSNLLLTAHQYPRQHSTAVTDQPLLPQPRQPVFTWLPSSLCSIWTWRHVLKPSTWEVEAGGSRRVRSHPLSCRTSVKAGLHCMGCYLKDKIAQVYPNKQAYPCSTLFGIIYVCGCMHVCIYVYTYTYMCIHMYICIIHIQYFPSDFVIIDIIIHIVYDQYILCVHINGQ